MPNALLRARPDGKSDQIAQEPTGVRSHLLPLAARQSDAARSAHRRLLADAGIARRYPQDKSARRRRVRDLARKAAEDRRAHRRDRKPHQARARHRLSAGWTVPRSGRRLTAGRPVNDGAETDVRKPRSTHPSNSNAFESADRSSAKHATRNCARNHVAKKIRSDRQLGE